MGDVDRLAREAFYGGNPGLDARVRGFLGVREGEGWGVDLDEYVRAVRAMEGGPYRLTPSALGGGFLEGPDPTAPGRAARVSLDEGLWGAARAAVEGLEAHPAAAGLVLAHLVWGERAGLGPLAALDGAAPPEGARYLVRGEWPHEVRVAVRVEALGVWALAHPAQGPEGEPVLRVFAPTLAADVEGLLRRWGVGPRGVRELTAEERPLAHRFGELPPPPNPYTAAVAGLLEEALRAAEVEEMKGECPWGYCGEEKGALELLDEALRQAREAIAAARRKDGGGEG